MKARHFLTALAVVRPRHVWGLSAGDGKFRSCITCRIARRFSELRRDLASVSPKVLAQQLREMERDGIVNRKVYVQVPPKVEYSLTSMGRSLLPVVHAMCQWKKRR